MSDDRAAAWREAAVAGALTYHAAVLVLILPGAMGRLTDGISTYLDVVQALAVIPIALVVRATVATIRKREPTPAWIIGGDMLGYLLMIAIVGMVSIPGNLAGTAVFGVVVMSAKGLVAIPVLAALSLLVQRYRPLRIVLGTLVIADVLFAIVAVGLTMR